MVQPINYQLNVQSPFEAALGGFKIGATIADVSAQRQAQEQELARRQQLQTQVTALMQNQNPSARDFTNVAMLMPKAEADSMRANWETLSKDRQENELRFGGQVMSAFSANQPQIGIQLLRERATAERNAGREGQAKAYETWAQMAEVSPQSAQKTIGIMLAGVPGGDKVLTSSIQAMKAPAEIRTSEFAATKEELITANTPTRLALENSKTAANIRNLDSQIAERSNRLGLDRDKLQSDIQLKLLEFGEKAQKLDDSAIKIINESTVNSVSSEYSAARMLDLANRIQKEAPSSGLAAKGLEFYKRVTGDQNAITNLRNEYTRIRSKGVLNNLPPGAATDKDIIFAAKGFPEETDSTESITSFLRGMAKIAQYDAVQDSAKAEWVNSVGSLGRAKKDIEVGGIQIPKGSSYVDFARQFMGKRAQELAAVQAGREVAARGYMRWANPQTGAVPGGVPATPVTPAAPVGEVAAPSPFTGAP